MPSPPGNNAVVAGKPACGLNISHLSRSMQRNASMPGSGSVGGCGLRLRSVDEAFPTGLPLRNILALRIFSAVHPLFTSSWPERPDWRALQPFEHFLVRKVGDRDEWVIGVGTAADGTGTMARVGHIGYGFSEVTDRAPDTRAPQDGFAPMAWWAPRVFVQVSGGIAQWHAAEADLAIAVALMKAFQAEQAIVAVPPGVKWIPCTARDRYLEQVQRLLGHIQRGDIYEVNYCTERRARWPGLDPYAAFGALAERSQAPFAGFYRQGDRFALCASPERYLRLEPGVATNGRDRVVLEPMKGTRRRDADPAADRALAEALANDPKERSENIMAVDVARHDLSRVAAPRSVRVEALCAVRSHARVHQLVSTVVGELPPDRDLWDVVRATFPMASMTGAPKRKAMELIAAVEEQARGAFSGALGFRLPDGTVDLNVMIRTILFDAATGAASLMTGSAITAQSDPQQEWEECELKAQSVLNAIGHVG